ncbi:MAG: lactonase family protein [Fimbriimonas sp.]
MLFLPLLFPSAMSVPGPVPEVDMFVGTYTSPTGSKGIYRAKLNVETGAISSPELAVEAANPSFLALHPQGRFLYAVHETDDGRVSAYAIGDGRALRHLNTVPTDGAHPCHLSVDRQGKNVFVAAYSGGSLAVVPLRADGSLGPLSGLIMNTGSGPDRNRQNEPHMHAVYPDPENRFVYACDLGTDEVLAFRYDAEKGVLAACDPRSAKVPAGAGARHLAMHPSGRLAFVNNEMGNSVTVFRRDPETGTMQPVQTVSTLPEGATGSATAEIECHPNGRWLYVSNRGHDSIAGYHIGDDGTLKAMEVQPLGVKTPRSFAIDSSGKWMVVAGQNSNNLESFRIDTRTGQLMPTGLKASIGSPVCVVFDKP